MKTISRIILNAAIAATAVSALGAPAFARDWRHDRDRYHHRDRYPDYDDVRLRGPGVDDLNPWFRNARAGREYAANRAGTYVTEREAWLLNREFAYRDDGRWR